MKKWSNIFAYASIILLFLLHLPFLNSDPDYFLSVGRDAFTDEGLNTSQLRNFINYNYLDMNECDNLIKTPLFNLLLFLPLQIFGTYLPAARLSILVFFLIMILVLSRQRTFRTMIPVLVLTTLSQYYVFQYSHFSLSEMISTGFILISVQCIHIFSRKQTQKFIWLAACFLSLVYYSKIQFTYILPLLPLSIFILMWSNGKSVSGVILNRYLLTSIFSLIAFAAVYMLLWYLPSKETFDFVIADESAHKYAPLREIPKTIVFNIVYTLFNEHAWWFNTLVSICFISGVLLFRKTEDRDFRVLFVVASLWMIIELHKLSMIYLPSRYIVSYYVSAGLMSSVVLYHLILLSHSEKIFFRIGIAIMMLFLTGNSIQYIRLLEGRTYAIQGINNYFSSAMKNSQPVMGPWASAATWDCKARCLPVWKDFMNDKDLINRFQPQAILSEPDEDGSNQAYSSQRIDLVKLSDSTRTFSIGRWDVIVYWIKIR